MFELPLFSLNMVLFPGMPMGVHVFEERYKEMIGLCLKGDLSFGVTLLPAALAPEDLPPAPLVGCTARILRAQVLDDGRMNLVVLGGLRFRIRRMKAGTSYPVGWVDLYPLNPQPSADVALAKARLHVWVERYLKLWEGVSDQKLEPAYLPQDPVAYAYMASYLLQVEFWEKLPLLAAPGPLELFARLQLLYRREVTLIQRMVQRGMPDNDWPFSTN